VRRDVVDLAMALKVVAAVSVLVLGWTLGVIWRN
jgi:hypothetical protein